LIAGAREQIAMTRRIAVAILATVWATLIVFGVGAYLTTRAVLVADLDASLVVRAMARPEVVDENGRRYEPVSEAQKDERFIIKSDFNRTLGTARPTTDFTDGPHRTPEVVRAAFSRLADGTWIRTVTIRAYAYPADAGEDAPPERATVIFSASAAEADHLLDQLATSLVFAGAIGGLLSAAMARAVARRALRPLRDTAELFESVNDSNLHRRLDEKSLPKELAPVAGKLNEMLSRLEDSSRLRQQFFADASHELRTPVAAMRTAMEVALRRDRDSDAYRQTLELCLDDAKLLHRLVEALLEQVRSGSLTRQPQLQEVDLRQLIEACARTVAPLAEEKSLDVLLPTDGATPRLHTDLERLRSILLNLMSNAVEYTEPRGQMKVDFGPERDGVIIKVSDTGPGIQPEHLPHLFDPFYRTDSARTSGHLGLGLYLVRAHAQALGGTCEVSSIVGRGTEFRVWIPYVRDESPGLRDSVSHPGQREQSID
jgi:two-component system heavy metal sensor histidine kinase CusS